MIINHDIWNVCFWYSTLIKINLWIVVAIIPQCLLHVTLVVRKSLGSEDLQASHILIFVYFRITHTHTHTYIYIYKIIQICLHRIWVFSYSCFSTSTSKGFPWFPISKSTFFPLSWMFPCLVALFHRSKKADPWSLIKRLSSLKQPKPLTIDPLEEEIPIGNHHF